MREITELEKPGICLRCGKDTRLEEYGDRDTGGFCNECHNLNYQDYRRKLKEHNEKQKQLGIKYWSEKGIRIGDTVQCVVIAWTGLQASRISGIAKTGNNGAYVSSKFQPGKLAPGGWNKAELAQPDPCHGRLCSECEIGGCAGELS